MNNLRLTKQDLVGCLPDEVQEGLKKYWRSCFTCAYFSQTEDSNLCWYGDTPTEISIREDCRDWEK